MPALAQTGEQQKSADLSIFAEKGEWLPQGFRLLVGIILRNIYR